MRNVGKITFDINKVGNDIICKKIEFKNLFIKNYSILLLDNSNLSLDLASQISVEFGFEVFNNIIEISNDSFKCQTFSGKSSSVYQIKDDQKFILILSKTFKLNESISFDLINLEIDFTNSKADLISLNNNENTISLTDAKIVVGAGRGMKEPSNWGIIEKLAQKIGAGLACSKPVSDLNWRPHHEHVGQTGIKIAPKLYIACGISGAIQHLAGVNGSEIIVVINSDPEAPFVKNADYAIIGDLFQVVPELLKNIK